jgi:hypothetical protein
MAGGILRLWQYLANASLWIDEAALARNIIERPLPELFGSLPYAQVAPPDVLAVEKAAVTLFGTSEYALRLFPLISGIGALFIFRAVARRILDGWSVVFAVGLFALGIPFIYAASQVKQYSSDIAAALLLLLVALELHTPGSRKDRMVLMVLLAAALVWISQTALFVMAGITVAFLVLYWKGDDIDRRALIMALWVWSVSAAAAALHALSNVTDLDRQYFQAFWRVGFMPFPPERIRDVFWVPEQLIWVFGAFATGLGHIHGGLNYRWSPVFTAVMFYGLWSFWRSRRDAALFLTLPVLAVLGASAAGIYPFTARLLAFLIPFFLLAVAAGARQLVASLPQRLQFLTPVALAILGGSPLYAIATALPPSRIQHLRPALVHLAQHRQNGDAIYVYSGAALSFRYYASRLELPYDDVSYGTCAIGNPRDYLEQLDRLRSKPRAWIVMTHEQQRGEREFILGYLKQIGRELDAVDIPSPTNHPTERASVHLYDLSAPRSNIDARTFPIPRTIETPPPGLLKWGCYGITGGEPLANSPPRP